MILTCACIIPSIMRNCLLCIFRRDCYANEHFLGTDIVMGDIVTSVRICSASASCYVVSLHIGHNICMN